MFDTRNRSKQIKSDSSLWVGTKNINRLCICIQYIHLLNVNFFAWTSKMSPSQRRAEQIHQTFSTRPHTSDQWSIITSMSLSANYTTAIDISREHLLIDPINIYRSRWVMIDCRHCFLWNSRWKKRSCGINTWSIFNFRFHWTLDGWHGLYRQNKLLVQ